MARVDGHHPGRPADPRGLAAGDAAADAALQRMLAQAAVVAPGPSPARVSSVKFEVHQNWTVRNLDPARLASLLSIDAPEDLGIRLLAIELEDRTLFLVTTRAHRESLAGTVVNDAEDSVRLDAPSDPVG